MTWDILGYISLAGMFVLVGWWIEVGSARRHFRMSVEEQKRFTESMRSILGKSKKP